MGNYPCNMKNNDDQKNVIDVLNGAKIRTDAEREILFNLWNLRNHFKFFFTVVN